MARGRRLSAIVFTDMVDSTQLAQKDERSALALIKEQEDLARSLVARHHGRLVKSTGDGLLMEFPSALDAMECTVALQRRVHERNEPSSSPPLRLRVGIHLGDVQRRGGDIFGDAVNVAARVESAADPGGICVSESVYNLVRNKVPYGLEPLGAQSLKGVAEPMALFRVVLPWARATSLPSPDAGVPRLAVLPLSNISPDPNDAYFADGLTEELIAVLSKIDGLRVIARTSVVPYKSTTKSVAQIGAELSVRSLLEGSVRKAGDRLRITLQLIDVASQEHVWSERFDRELSDVFAIQTEVAESTARAIRVELSDDARASLQRSPTRDLGAYDLYLRAVATEGNLGPEMFAESVRLLEEAIRRDPEFALGYARLGHLFVQGAGEFLSHHEGFARARPLIARALELESELSDAHAASASLAMQEEHDWTRAEAEFERALALNPSNTSARVNYSTLLKVLGRYDDAERQIRSAVETNPNWWIPRWLLVDLALTQGDVGLAERRLELLLRPDPNPQLTHLTFAMLYAHLGRASDARHELDHAGPSTALPFRVARAVILATLNEPEEARALLKELTDGTTPEFLSRDYLAALYAAVGEREKALAVVEASAKERESGLWLRYVTPVFDSIRDDPRFESALRSFRLPEEITRKALQPRFQRGV